MYSKLKKLAHNGYYSFRGCFTADEKGTRFVIFAQGRSGSTALRALLTNPPNVLSEGELLMEHKFLPHKFLDGKAQRHTSEGLAWGFKLKWWHLTEYQNQDVCSFLRNLYERDWKIIYLRRRNILFQALSTLSGEARSAASAVGNTWQYEKEEQVETPKIDTDKIESYVESRKD